MKIALSTSLLALLLSACASGPRVTDHGAVAARPSPSALPEGWQRGAFMEVFVRAYQDSDGDGIGDLRGLIQPPRPPCRLLGVTGLWLMPVTKAPTATTATPPPTSAPSNATTARWPTSTSCCARPMRAASAWSWTTWSTTRRLAAPDVPVRRCRAPATPVRDWFVWSEVAPQGWDIWGKNPWYHTVSQQPWNWPGEWKDLPQAPRASTSAPSGRTCPTSTSPSPAVLDWHLDNLRFWLNRGLDGFRLDAVPHLVETQRQGLERPARKPPADQTPAGPDPGLPEPLRGLRGHRQAGRTTPPPRSAAAPSASGWSAPIMGAVGGRAGAVQKLADYFKTRPQRMATMLANHDIFAGQRIWDQVQGDEARYRLAAASLLLLPGIPFLYYGEEIGQAGLPQLKGDGPIRGPMSWNADGGFSTSAQPFRPTSPNAATHNAEAQRADPGSLFHHYRQLVALRRQHAALHSGRYEAVQVDGSLLCFERVADAERLRVCLNYGPDARALPARGGRPLWAAPQAPADTLPAWGVRVERLV
jgi:alpha-amylase